VRQPHEYRDIHAEADKFEPRLARAFERSAERLQSKVSMDTLAAALASGSIRKAMNLFPAEMIEEVMQPSVDILSDAYLRGGRTGGVLLNAAKKRGDIE
jgi:hypothetical protein